MKLTSPLLSAGVSGQKGKTLTYRQTKHGKILTPYAKPSQPNSPDQVAWRNTFSQSRDEWDALSPHLKQLWRSSAVSRRYRYAGYPMWMKYRMQDIRDGLSWNAYSKKLDWKYLPVLPGLVLWAQMEKGSGTTVYDFTRTNPGTIYGATWELVNEQIYGLDFDGNDDYVEIPYIIDPSSTSWTACAWFTTPILPSDKGANMIVLQQADGTGTGRGWIYLHYDDNTITTYLGGALNPSGVTVETNTYYHVCLTWDKGTNALQWYINGVAKNSYTTSIESATGEHLLGIHKDLTSGPFEGTMAEALLCNRALSEAEIVHNYLLLKNTLQP